MHLLDRRSVVGLYCMHFLTWKRAPATAGEIAGEGGLGEDETLEGLRRLWRGGLVNGGGRDGKWWISYDPARTSIADILGALEEPDAPGEGGITGRLKILFTRFFVEGASRMRALEVFCVKPEPVGSAPGKRLPSN